MIRKLMEYDRIGVSYSGGYVRGMYVGRRDNKSSILKKYISYLEDMECDKCFPVFHQQIDTLYQESKTKTRSSV